MLFSRFPAALAAVGILLTAEPTVLATTWIVDANNGAGTNFTDIPPAIAAAQAGDLILVRAGSYSAFVLGKGLTILGQVPVNIGGTITIAGIPAGEIAAIERLVPSDLVTITGNSGTVLVAEVPQDFVVGSSDDVRMRGIDFQDGTSSTQLREVLYVDGSRVEIVSSTLLGAYGSFGPCSGNDTAQSGQPAIRCLGSSRVHLVESSCTGGAGWWGDFNCHFGGSGAAGVEMQGGSLVVAGATHSVIQGGDYGPGYEPLNGCMEDGYAASGLHFSGASEAWYSECRFLGGLQCCSDIFQTHCWYVPGIQGQPVTLVSPVEPALEVTGVPSAGSSVVFHLHGEPGAAAFLSFGTAPAVVGDHADTIGRLIGPWPTASTSLGMLPADGDASLSWKVPNVAPGTKLFIQGTVVSGTVTSAFAPRRRTNSIFLIVE